MKLRENFHKAPGAGRWLSVGILAALVAVSGCADADAVPSDDSTGSSTVRSPASAASSD